MQPLDNPVWHALIGLQDTVAEGGERARRYRPEYSVWSAIGDEEDPSAWAELRDVVGPGGVALFAVAPRHPADWETLRTFPVYQMMLDDLIDGALLPPTISPLGPDDADAMAVLAHATEPGPWCERTAELGDFVGIRRGTELVAMAGERMRLPTAVEISGVCSAVDVRGRGYAGALVAETARTIQARGATPFLHVRAENTTAQRVYERLGFRRRTVASVTLVRAPD